jgi:hypothetical protein
MNVVADEGDVAVGRRERPAQVEEIFAGAEAVDGQAARFIDDGPAVGFPNKTSLDDSPVLGRFEAVEGGEADTVAVGRAVVPGGGFNAAGQAL